MCRKYVNINYFKIFAFSLVFQWYTINTETKKISKTTNRKLVKKMLKLDFGNKDISFTSQEQVERFINDMKLFYRSNDNVSVYYNYDDGKDAFSQIMGLSPHYFLSITYVIDGTECDFICEMWNKSSDLYTFNQKIEIHNEDVSAVIYEDISSFTGDFELLKKINEYYEATIHPHIRIAFNRVLEEMGNN